MIIAQNPIIRSWVNLAVFWYFGMYLTLGGLHGAYLTDLPWYVIASVTVAAVGLVIGFTCTFFLAEHSLRATGSDLKRGTYHDGIILSMGSMPYLPTAAMARKAGPAAILSEQPWWPVVRARSPLYADAISEVMRVMWTVPRLPASPVPGGHGGRSLVEHSLAVAKRILVEAQTWTYTGQYDKRGNLRVPLAQRDEPHRFTVAEVPMLILTALAHDIGKVRCYELLDKAAASRVDGPVHQVREVRLKHDVVGGQLMRELPGIRALPLEDRIAVITAITYYHHPFSIPMAGWVTDRIRSLTELLIKADIATGKAEGHAMNHDGEYDEAEAEGEPEPAEDRKRRTGALAAAAPQLIDDSEEEADAEAEAMAILATRPVKASKPERTAAAVAGHRAPAQAPATTDVPRELGMFMVAARADGGINGLGQRGAGSRIAWKVGDTVYVIDNAMRRIITNRARPEDAIWVGQACADGSNGSAFTLALLEQLDKRGYLIKEANGRVYPASRALFKVGSPNGRDMTVFMVRTDAIPGAQAIADAQPMRMIGPLWGEQTAFRASAAAPARAVAGEPSAAGGGRLADPSPAQEAPVFIDDAEDLSQTRGRTTERTPPPTATEADSSNSTAPDLMQYMLGLGPAPAPIDDSGAQTAEPIAEAVQQGRPDSGPPEASEALPQALPYLLETIASAKFLARPEIVIKSGDEGRKVYVPAESETGATMARLLQDFEANGFDVSGVRKVRTDDGQGYYLFVLPPT